MMISPEWQQIADKLIPQKHEIAAHWLTAVFANRSAPGTNTDLQLKFEEMTGQIIHLLCSDTTLEPAARAIGSSLIKLELDQPQILRDTHAALTHGFEKRLTAAQNRIFHERLDPFLAEVAIGFYISSRGYVFLTREQVEDKISPRNNNYNKQYQTLFDQAPISIWDEDFSSAVNYLRSLQQTGVTDMRAYFDENPEVLANCARLIKIIDVNQRTVELYEAEGKEEFFTKLESFFTQESYLLFREVILAAFEGKRQFSGEAVNKTASGRIIHIFLQWAVVPGYEVDYGRVLVSIIDISPRKKIELKLQRQSDRRRILYEIEKAILIAQSPEEISQISLERLLQLVPYWAAAVSITDSAGQFATLLAAHLAYDVGDLAAYAQTGRTYSIRSQEMMAAMKARKIFYREDISELVRRVPLLRRIDDGVQRGLLQIPLHSQGNLLGSLSLIADGPGGFSSEDIEIASEVADSLAIAINNVQLLEKERAARKQAESLREVAALLNLSTDSKQILPRMLEQLMRVIQTDAAAILLISDGGLETAAYKGKFIAPPGLSPEEMLDLKTVSTILERHQPLVISDTTTDARWLKLPGTEHVRSWMGVPLMVKKRVIGLLTFDKDMPGFYKDVDANLAMAFANQAALTIENARLFQDTQLYAEKQEKRVAQRTQDLKTLYEVTAITSEFMQLDIILAQALKVVLGFTKAGHAGFYQWNRKSGKIKLLAQSNTPADDATQEFIKKQITRVILESSPSIIPITTSAKENKNQFFIGVPAQVKGRIIGVLSILGPETSQLSAEEIELITTVADHIGVAVENALLHQQAEAVAVLKARDRLARELHDAVTQGLYSLSLFTEAVKDRLDSGNFEEARTLADDISVIARQALKEMRLMLYELQDASFKDVGLVEALQFRLEMVEEKAGIKPALTAVINEEPSVAVERALYLVAQEALSNSLKYANATQVEIDITIDEGTALMTITDNGSGFDPRLAVHRPGLGLNNMKGRIEDMGGSFIIHTSPGKGTTIKAALDAGSGPLGSEGGYPAGEES